MKKIKSQYMAILTGIAILFSSCAVLMVDVDVYKGPLANHKDVQTEQMAAMAIGAKPLLVELRDILEANYMRFLWDEDRIYEVPKTLDEQSRYYLTYGGFDLKIRLNKLRELPWYKSAYVPPDPNSYSITKSHFRDSSADHVNNVLYLYQNSISDEYLELRTRSNQALKHYKDAYKSLRPEKMVDDEGLAKSIRSVDGDLKNVKKLKEAYINFLSDTKRDALSVIKYSMEWLEQTRTKDERISGLKTNPLLKEDNPVAKKVPNVAFHILAETDLVDLHAKLVFKLQGDPKEELVSRVKEIARMYLKARAALEDLWRISIETIIYINRRPMADGETKEQRRELTERFVDLSLELIQPRYLAMLVTAIEDEELPEDVEAFRSTYMTYVDRHSLEVFSYAQAKASLRDRLIADPIERAGKLLVAHEFSKDKFNPESKSEDILRGSLAYKQGWEFGLARAPYGNLDPDELREITQKTDDLRVVTQKTEQAFAGEGGALGGGRLDKGLETLIEEYLNAAANDITNDNEDKEEYSRRQLTNALVRFAQKILFIANNNSLISPPKESGLVLGLIDATVRGISGDRGTKWISRKLGFPLGGGVEAYTRILQAVGNSILVQADALHQEEAHEKKMAQSVDSEIYAINRTFTQLPSSVIDKLLQSLRAEQAAKTKEIEKAKSELTAATGKWDEAKRDFDEIKKQISITPANNETFVELAEREEQKVISAHLLFVTEQLLDPNTSKFATDARDAVLRRDPALIKPDKCADALATELAAKAKRIKVSTIKELISNASEYFTDDPNNFPSDDCQNERIAYDKVISVVKEDYSMVKPWIDLATKADNAQKLANDQNKIVGDISTSIGDSEIEKTKVEHAIIAIADAKYAVLKKADETKAGSKITAQFLYELLKVTLEESLANAANKPEDSNKFQDAIAVLKEQTPPIEPVMVDMSKLPSKPSAKDVRDLWITVLQYEHDLALSKGEKPRADEIMEAIEAARKKREDMIFIRPAMAYLRTSFPATSLQSNPNLTWDNMLGGHMMRSVPFGPFFRDLLDPEGKRDARINAEIDKQFWQNINRVRVAGGGDTNYAVVKDDIGNWYVKGYSSNPEDIIKSAKSLAMFSLSAKMNTDLLDRINRDKDEPPSEDIPDANQTAVGRMYNKYTDQYNSRTRADHDRLIELLKSEIKSDILRAWQRNEELKEEDVPKLENKLNATIEIHLKNPTDELEKTKDVTEQGSKIISAMHAIRRFHNTLLTDVHDTVTVPARNKLLEAEKKKDAAEKAKLIDVNKEAAFKDATDEYVKAKAEYDAARRAEESSIRDVTRIVREKIVVLITSRMNSVQDYETALMFIGETSKN